jgi:hypothetical protein
MLMKENGPCPRCRHPLRRPFIDTKHRMASVRLQLGAVDTHICAICAVEILSTLPDALPEIQSLAEKAMRTISDAINSAEHRKLKAARPQKSQTPPPGRKKARTKSP